MIYTFQGKTPDIAAASFVAENATLLGEVRLAAGSNVWYGAVLRGDDGPITLCENANVQDNAVVHMDPGGSVVIGKNVTVGHGAIIHGCTIGENTLVGMGATLMNHCEIGKGCIIGAGALVPEGMIVPDGSLVVGVPAKIRGNLSEEQAEAAIQNALHYVKLGAEHAKL
ncbi:MAG: gamma carbonic anhydrase family protein [Faecalibacterium sp.]